MKAVFIVAFLAMAMYVFAQEPIADCPEVNEKNATLLPNPQNCSTYIICVWGEPILRPCPEGLLWNNELKVCDWPENSDCVEP